jgi:hypothetical protein
MKKIFYFLIFPSLTLAFVPFGGPILDVKPCCNGLMLTIDRYYRFWPGGPPTLHEVGTYLFGPGSILIVGALTPGKWSLGLAFPGGVCLITTNPLFPCSTPIPTLYTIHFIGTSIPFSFQR